MRDRAIAELIKDRGFVGVGTGITVADCAQRMKAANAGAVLVVEKDRLLGILTERDILVRVVAAHQDPNTTLVADVMTPDPQTISPDKPFDHALHIMYERGFRHLPVIADGRPVGMVCASDALGPELEGFKSELTMREKIAEALG